MEYVYTALMLHSAGKPIDEAGIARVLEAAGIAPNADRVRVLVDALAGVDLNRAISKAPATPTGPSPSEAAPAPPAEATPPPAQDPLIGLESLFGPEA